MNTEINPIGVLSEAFDRLSAENEGLKESIAAVRHMMSADDVGWTLLGSWMNGDHLEGLDLDEVKEIADKLAPRVAGGSLPKRASDLHSGFTWGRGWFISGTEKPKGSGRPPATRLFFTNPNNQEALFSDVAREELQKERFISGNIIAAVDTSSKTVNRIPFKQIIGLKVDPDFPERVTAYLREWDTQDGTNKSVRRRWYVTRRFTGPVPKTMAWGDRRVEVVQDTVAVDLRANRQVGFVLGVPDGLAGLAWSEAYGRVMSYGESVQESLARVLYRVTNKTKQGTASTGVKIANFSGHGGTASMAEGQELTAISTAGRGYDFASARPLAAMAAAAWNVSTMDLLNDSSAAGSSYGSASALIPGNRNAMLLMQREWADFFKDIFEVAGFERPTIVFEPFEAPDKYRELQAITLGSVALSDEEYRMVVLDALDIVGEARDIPETLKNRGVDANASANAGAQQAAPDQGVANGSGGGGQGANDLRSDTVSSSEALRREMALESLAERLENALARIENI